MLSNVLIQELLRLTHFIYIDLRYDWLRDRGGVNECVEELAGKNGRKGRES
jgi:hypothetical protein